MILPKLSIITVNLNNASGLSKTIESVVNQNFENFEFLIIDGGSNDGSTDVINKFSPKITYWISESDKGIYNAMNKGIKAAKGEYLLFLNSGDYLYNSSVLESWNKLMNPETDICSGKILMIDGSNSNIVVPVKVISLYYCVYDGLGHPNTFIRKSLFNNFGYYNENNKITSDWEFYLQVLGLNNSIYQSIEVIVSCFNRDGLSTDPNNAVVIRNEKRSAIAKHVPKAIQIDLDRLHYFEEKMTQTNFKTLVFLERKPVLANIIFAPLRIFSYITRKLNMR